MKVRKCLILAAAMAGTCNRLQIAVPSPWRRFADTPLLEHIILSAHQAGVKNFVVVVGYRGELIQKYFVNRQLAGVSLEWIENPDYHKENGISALSARDRFHEPFLLLLGDRLFHPETAWSLLPQPFLKGEVILAVEPKIDPVFDLENVTKVRLEGETTC